MIVLMSIGASSLAIAQTPPSESTSPSSPSTQQTPNEKPTTGSSTSRPASASSPHQREALNKQTHEQMMKDCIAKERAQNADVSKDDAKAACKDQLKASSEPTNR